MPQNSALVRARMWVFLVVGILAILGVLFGYVNSRTEEKLETVGLRIETVEKDVQGHDREITRHRRDFGEVKERLVRIETRQEVMVEKQDQTLRAIERLRDE